MQVDVASYIGQKGFNFGAWQAGLRLVELQDPVWLALLS